MRSVERSPRCVSGFVKHLMCSVRCKRFLKVDHAPSKMFCVIEKRPRPTILCCSWTKLSAHALFLQCSTESGVRDDAARRPATLVELLEHAHVLCEEAGSEAHRVRQEGLLD